MEKAPMMQTVAQTPTIPSTSMVTFTFVLSYIVPTRTRPKPLKVETMPTRSVAKAASKPTSWASEAQLPMVASPMAMTMVAHTQYT